MLDRILKAAAGAVIVALLGLVTLYRLERDGAQEQILALVDELSKSQVQLAAFEEASRVAARAREIAVAEAKRAVEENVKWEQLVNELQGMEGGDAPLSDFLSRAAGRLWGQ